MIRKTFEITPNSLLKCRTLRLALLASITMLLCPQPGHAWFFFSKPAYEAQVVDIDTGAPLEGAAVVAIYYADTLVVGDSGLERVIHVQETVTDQDGRFHIPPYSTLIVPWSRESNTYFTIYKPGYTPVYEMDIEECVSGECKANRVKWIRNMDKIRKISSHKIELSILHNKEDRRRAIPGVPIYENNASYEKLVRIINKERYILGID